MCTSTQKKLCGKVDCETCYERSFMSYDGVTKKGKKKIYCWDYEKNDVGPINVSKGTGKKYWFICDVCNHEFESGIDNITRRNGSWCSYCTKNTSKLCNNIKCNHCHDKSLASFSGKTKKGNKKIECWNIEKNIITTRQVTKCNGKKYWFICDICDHEFKSVISGVVKCNTWCPYCSVPPRKICKDTCNLCYEKTFASYKGKTKNGKMKVECWSEKNKKLPRDVFKSSTDKIYFKCDICLHEFKIILNSLYTNNSWCPYCFGNKICINDCKFCYNKSFASYEGITNKGKLKIDCWSSQNIKNPRDICKKSNKKFNFVCDICYHLFSSNLGNIINNKWCPYCSEPVRKICPSNECKHCYSRSFASYEGITIKGGRKVDCWNHEKNILIPRHVTKGNDNKFHFICDVCDNKFSTSLDKITGRDSRWCPFCKNKTEGKFKHHFEEKYPHLKLKHQAKWEWCKSKKDNYLPFDFAIKKLKIIIEIDGEQHFSQVSNWSSPEDNLSNDIYKMKKAMENGYSIIRILQEDIWSDKNEWDKKLDKILKKHDEPTVFYIGCEIKYDKHINCS